MRELLVATKNPGKFREISEALFGVSFKIIFLGDLNLSDGDFVEDGETFLENARKKAEYYFKKTGLMTLGEDSGIFVNALGDELGVKTRRWGAGRKADDKEWMDYFMKRMEGAPDRRARFVCNACLFWEGIDEQFEAETCGMIAEVLMAPIVPGIPLGSCFIPDGMNKAYAQLSVEEKNTLSHRGKVMAKVMDVLINFNAD